MRDIMSYLVLIVLLVAVVSIATGNGEGAWRKASVYALQVSHDGRVIVVMDTRTGEIEVSILTSKSKQKFPRFGE